jgi:hypothetical protein
MSIRPILKRLLVAITAAVSFTAAPATAQINLPPGGTVTPPNASPPSVFVASQIIPFTISSAAAALYRGELQDQVFREVATGRLIFSQRLRNPQNGLNGIIDRVVHSSFAGVTTDVSWRTGLGTAVPSLATRSVGVGHDVTFDFNPGVFSSAESVFYEVFTNASSFANTGSTTIILTSGHSVTLQTFQPAAGSPVAEITSPSAFGCVCSPATITGTASAGGSLASWTLGYSTNPAGPYNTIVTSTTPVVSGTLATWNTAALSQGYYWLKLSVLATDGTSAVAFTVVFVDSQFDTLVVRSPVGGGVYGGVVCFDGTITDQCFRSYTLSYRPTGNLLYTTILTSNSAVINDPLGNWSAGGQPDGNYQVRASAQDQCGHTATVTRDIVIDNTPPSVIITRPEPCTSVRGLVRVVGSAVDTHMSQWVLEYTGGTGSGWTTIASGDTNVINGTLAIWDTRELPACCYTLRLRATDAVAVNCDGPHYSEYLVSIDVGDSFCGADFNQDGGVDGADVEAFFQVWENGGCLP